MSLFVNVYFAGLFHRAIAQSGTPNAVWATHTESHDQLKDHVTTLATAHGCDTSDTANILKCLRNLPWEVFRDDEICKVGI